MSTSRDISTAVPDQPGAAPGVKLAFAALVVAMLPAVLDQTILATALPTVAGDLGRLADVSLLVTAYVVASTAATPLWGKLGDRLGHKPLLLGALLVFVAASCVCGAAQSLTQLIAARVVQGMSAGGLMTLAMTAVGTLVEPRERGRYQGYIAAAFAAAAALGPLVGGVLVDEVELALGVLREPAPGPDRRRRPGPAAALRPPRETPPPRSMRRAPGCWPRPPARCCWRACGAATVTRGTRRPSSVCWGATVLLGLALVARERRAADPVVPFSLLRTPAVAVASGGLFLGTAALFAIVVFVPLFLQTTAGASPTKAGLLLVPMTLGTTISTTLVGRRIAKTGEYRRFPAVGLGMMAVALGLMAVLAPSHSVVAAGAALVVFGLGFGGVSQVLLIAVQSSVDRRSMGTATAATGFFRALGGSLGAAALGAVFAAQADDVTAAVQMVFGLGAVIAVAALVVVARLPEGRLPERARAS